ncbi:MAG: SMP-30/gluconolactonase/LRE family protein [Nitrospinae bacterium]|nr:SMP-30/gluconolactonase/LRE family protein [Nitrospinota bacterium]
MESGLAGIVEAAEPMLVATDIGATEGPLWHSSGFLTFVDMRRSHLLRWDPAGGVRVIREQTGEGNGCTLDRQGRLIMCEGSHRRVTRTEPDGSIVTLAERWQGKRLNRPNDVVCRSDGTVFFTDPELRVPLAEREVSLSGVYGITPQGELQLATDECEYPNGLAFSPDERVLYVAISRLDERCFEEEKTGAVCRHRRIRAFDVDAEGRLRNNRIFVDMSSAEPGVPDGMKVDRDGRVYCTGSGGIWVIDPQGRRLGIIRVPEVPRNLAFGGPDYRTLYITAGTSVYSLRTKVTGLGA